jgi:hypothetical protein
MPTGRYAGTLTLDPGEWTITVHSGFGRSRLSMLPIAVVPSGAPAPARPSPAERGRRLFVAKGCVTCHVHREAPAGEAYVGPVGPELTDRRYGLEYLARFLADPGAQERASEERRMPNLGLDSAETAALVAFINTARAMP